MHIHETWREDGSRTSLLLSLTLNLFLTFLLISSGNNAWIWMKKNTVFTWLELMSEYKRALLSLGRGNVLY